MELKLTLKSPHDRKLLRLQKLFGDNKPQTTIRKLIEDFKIE